MAMDISKLSFILFGTKLFHKSTPELDKPADSVTWMKDGNSLNEQAGKFRITRNGTR
jgi:hypothetical protein